MVKQIKKQTIIKPVKKVTPVVPVLVERNIMEHRAQTQHDYATMMKKPHNWQEWCDRKNK